MKFLLLILTCGFGAVAASSTSSHIKNLVGEPDYRKVKLHWETDRANNATTTLDNFQIRYCELQTWGAQRCRTKLVNDEYRIDGDDDIKVYSTDVSGLRMATTYSFEVRLKSKEANGGREDRANNADDMYQNVIVIPTKGFSARATQCLPHASEIEVSTGPFFGGRIAVEATDGERCAIDGEPNNPKDTYTLRINHAECGSRVNETTVATFVIVQENLPILTHSTRRFLVLCTYQPETLTVRAGINLPTHHQHHRGSGYGNVSPYEDSNGRNSRQARHMRQQAEALVHQEDFQEGPNNSQSNSNNNKNDDAHNHQHHQQQQRNLIGKNNRYGNNSSNNLLPIALIAILMIAIIIGFIAIVLKWNLKTINERNREFDNVSIQSDATSCCTTTDLNEIQKKQTMHK